VRFVVLGAGLAGVTSAWELLRDGHQVVVVDRGSESANFSSYANAGLVAPGHAFAWASPSAPRMMLRSLWRNDQAIRFRPQLDFRQWRWIMAFLGQCNHARAHINTERKVRLCHYSQQCLNQVVEETSVTYEGQAGGLVYFYLSRSSFAAAAKKSELLKNFGLKIEALDPEGLIELDPGLSDAKDKIAGALYCPSDESGDARLFTQALAAVCQENGATFQMNTPVRGFLSESGTITAVDTPTGPIEGDAFVLSLGVHSPELVRPLGIRLPIYPVKGYSVTLPIGPSHRPPKLGGVDEDHLLAYCPMGDHFRITATAEISGYDTSFQPNDFRIMLEKTRELLPEAADYSAPEYWACLRPMTPTGLPFIDRTRFPNLWLNTGHGHMGWTMACGSAKILADLVAGRPPEIPREGMTLTSARH